MNFESSASLIELSFKGDNDCANKLILVAIL